MKLGHKFFTKDQPIWGKPLIEYDAQKMQEVFSEIPSVVSDDLSTQPTASGYDISLETELYLMVHAN